MKKGNDSDYVYRNAAMVPYGMLKASTASIIPAATVKAKAKTKSKPKAKAKMTNAVLKAMLKRQREDHDEDCDEEGSESSEDCHGEKAHRRGWNMVKSMGLECALMDGIFDHKDLIDMGQRH